MDFDFTLFEPKKPHKRQNTEPAVEITKSGRILFNKLAVDLLGDKKYCKLGYDAANNAIGVLPLDEDELNSFHVRYTAKGAYIGAKSFFNNFGILPTEKQSCIPTTSNEFIAIKL